MSESAILAPPRVIRIVVVQPYRVVRELLRGMMSWEPDIEIIADVADIGRRHCPGP